MTHIQSFLHENVHVALFLWQKCGDDLGIHQQETNKVS